MKLHLSDVRLLKESINIISELVSEVCFQVDSEKISLLATDPANVAMVNFKLYAGAFAEYDVPKPVSLAVNLENLKAVLRRAKPEDSITLGLDSERNRLSIELVGSGRRNFNLALLDIDSEEQKMPKLKFTASADLPAPKFDEAIEDMEIVSDSVAFVVSKDKLTVQAEGNVSDAKVELPASSENSIKLDAEDEVASKYALSYLLKMVGGSKLAETVSIKISQDYPLLMSYSVENKLELSFILAPRVSND